MGTYIPDRLKKLRTEMAVKGLDAVLITKRENYIWLSGFTGTSAWLVITADEAVLTTDFRYGEQAAAQAPEYTVNIYQGNAANALKSLIDSLEVRKLGFEDYNMTFEQYTEYSTKFTDCEMIALGSVVQDMREIKDPGELLLLKKAVEIADAAFSHIIGCIRPGMTEMEVAAEMEHHMRRLGAAGPSFETIIASGERSSLPHGLASDKRLAAGDPVTMDFGAIYGGYCSDMTRTIFIGQPSAEMKKIYNIVLEAQLSAERAIKAGVTGSSVDAVARELIASMGYGDNFGHGLGHGVGLEIHEEPRLSTTASKKLEKGMVVTVEPGIYISRMGGVRIEDMVVVEEDGALVLTASTKEIIVL